MSNTQHLVQMANDNGGRDNISVVLIKVPHSRKPNFCA